MSRHHETTHTGNFHRKGYFMLHQLNGATIQVANLVNYICRFERWQSEGERTLYSGNRLLLCSFLYVFFSQRFNINNFVKTFLAIFKI